MVIDITYGCKGSIHLVPVKGGFIPFNSSEVPESISEPLMISDKGDIEAMPVGYRSSIVSYGNKHYKLKGCRPYDGTDFRDGEPFGVLSRTKALNELDITERLNDFYRSVRIEGPHEPLGNYVYENNIDGRDIACNVFETRGELRMNQFFSRYLEHKDKFKDMDYDFISGIFEWLGFAQHALKECNIGINKYEKTIDPANHTISRIDGGYGIFCIDHSSSRTGCYWKPQETYLDNLAIEWLVFGRYISMGYTAKDIRINEIEFELDYDDIELIGSLKDQYREFYESGDVPEPLDPFIVGSIDSVFVDRSHEFLDSLRRMYI